jgi:hypothetical protein
MRLRHALREERRVVRVVSLALLAFAFALLGSGCGESDAARANRLARKYPNVYVMGHGLCAKRDQNDLANTFSNGDDRLEAIARGISDEVKQLSGSDEQGETAAVGCFDAWGGLGGRSNHPLSVPPGGNG